MFTADLRLSATVLLASLRVPSERQNLPHSNLNEFFYKAIIN